MLLILSFLVSKGKKPIAHYGCANMNGPICKSCIDITYIEDITRWREDMNFIFEWQNNILRTSAARK